LATSKACSEEEVRCFGQWRRQRLPLWRIARDSGRSLATLSRHMKRLGLSRLKSLEPIETVRRVIQHPPEQR
jgi:hypothetical protein